MTRAELLLTASERALLGSAIGSAWDHYGAQASLDDGRYALRDLFVQTDAQALTISVGLDVLDLEGGAEEYARLHVSPGAAGAGIAGRKGDLFFTDRGRTITGIMLVRDAVRSCGNGVDGFDLVSDSGIVFVLDAGVVAICAGGPFASDLYVTRAASPDALRLDDGFADWGEDLGNQLAFGREVIPLVR